MERSRHVGGETVDEPLRVGLVDRIGLGGVAAIEPNVVVAGGEREFRVVGHHHDGALGVGQASNHGGDLLHMAHVKAAGRLVEDDDGAFAGQCGGDCHTLFLASGQRKRVPLGKRVQIEFGENLQRQLLVLLGLRKHDLVNHGFGEQLGVDVLQNGETSFETLLAPQTLPRRRDQFAAAPFVQSLQAPRERGFAGPVDTGERRDLTDGEIETVDVHRLAGLMGVGVLNIGEPKGAGKLETRARPTVTCPKE